MMFYRNVVLLVGSKLIDIIIYSDNYFWSTISLYAMFTVVALVSSILTLTLISCDRFFGVVFAMKAHLTERRARSCLLGVWVCALGVGAPLLVYRVQFSRTWSNHQVS